MLRTTFTTFAVANISNIKPDSKLEGGGWAGNPSLPTVFESLPLFPSLSFIQQEPDGYFLLDTLIVMKSIDWTGSILKLQSGFFFFTLNRNYSSECRFFRRNLSLSMDSLPLDTREKRRAGGARSPYCVAMGVIYCTFL